MRKWALIAAVLLAFAGIASADDAKPVNGALCFVVADHAPDCRSVKWASVPVATLTDKAFGLVTLTMRGDRLHGWPEEVQIRVTDAHKSEWTWHVPAKNVESHAQLRLPAGKYAIVFSAEHHLTEERHIDLVKKTDLREVLLRPMPVLRGRVLTMKEQPVANAEIVRPDRKLIARSDEQGNFRGEAGEPLPDAALIEKAGFGFRQLPLQLAKGDADLGIIKLSAGVKLSLHIERADGNHDPLRVALQRKTEDRYQYTPIASKELAADDDKLVFEDLSSGDYMVIVEGKNPVERLTTAVKLDAEDVKKDVKIEPYRVDGTASIGDDPMDGELGINMSRFGIMLKLPVVNGRFSATVWQHGTLVGFLQAKQMGTFEVVKSPELGADPSAWDIRLPKRMIQGRVYDAETKQAIDGAKMELLRSSGDSRWYGTIRLQDDGAYSILAVKPGTYELTVTAPDYTDMKQAVEIREDDNGSFDHDFALTHGQLATLEVVWPSGAPVANAAVLDGVASDGYQAERHYTLDAAGRLSLRLPKGESRTLYIVPREGSFAVAHLAAQSESDASPTRVVVPDPVGSLRIEIATADGKPAKDAAVGMRFNGETIPAPVLYEIGFRVSLELVSDRSLLQMPAGAYELWPVAKQAWNVSSRSRPAIGDVKRVNLSSGVTTVDLVANH